MTHAFDGSAPESGDSVRDGPVWTRRHAFSTVSGTGVRVETRPRARRTGVLLGLDVAAQVHQRRDRVGHERARTIGVRERVRPWAHELVGSLRVDLRLDDAGRAVVD